MPADAYLTKVFNDSVVTIHPKQRQLTLTQKGFGAGAQTTYATVELSSREQYESLLLAVRQLGKANGWDKPARKAKSAEGRAEQLVREQKQWIEDHGGDLAGYIKRYGSKDDAEHYGDGGEAIYKADTDALARYEAGYAFWRKHA